MCTEGVNEDFCELDKNSACTKLQSLLKTNSGNKRNRIELQTAYVDAKFDLFSQKLSLGRNIHPLSKSEEKVMKRHHWKCKGEIESSLLKPLPTYNLPVNFSFINWHRIRPFFYIVIEQALNVDLNCKYVQEIGDTLIALFEEKHISALEAESLLRDWGIRPVQSRLAIFHIWNALVSINLKEGVPSLVLQCERELRAQIMSSCNYSKACSMAFNYQSKHPFFCSCIK